MGASRSDLEERALGLVRERSPETVEELAGLLVDEAGVSRQEALEVVVDLEARGLLRLTFPPGVVPVGLGGYLFSRGSQWFWAVMAASAVATLMVFTVTGGGDPLMYARYALGSFFVLFLPGFSLVKALFPTDEIGGIERVALSIGMSLALVPMVGLLLNYTPWGIRAAPVALGLLALVAVLSFIGLAREHSKKLDRAQASR